MTMRLKKRKKTTTKTKTTTTMKVAVAQEVLQPKCLERYLVCASCTSLNQTLHVVLETPSSLFFFLCCDSFFFLSLDCSFFYPLQRQKGKGEVNCTCYLT